MRTILDEEEMQPLLPLEGNTLRLQKQLAYLWITVGVLGILASLSLLISMMPQFMDRPDRTMKLVFMVTGFGGCCTWLTFTGHQALQILFKVRTEALPLISRNIAVFWLAMGLYLLVVWSLMHNEM